MKTKTEIFMYKGQGAAESARARFMHKHRVFNELMKQHKVTPPISKLEEASDEFEMMWFNQAAVIDVGPVVEMRIRDLDGYFVTDHGIYGFVVEATMP